MNRQEREAAQQMQEEDHQVLFDLLGVSFHFDLRVKVGALFRLDEVAVVTREKAPELASSFADGEHELAKIVNRARMARDQMEEVARCAWARLLLDVAPGELATRDLRYSQDAAAAVVRQRDEYQEPYGAYLHLCWVVRDLEARRERLHQAHSTVLRVFGESGPRRPFSAGDLGGPTGKYGNAKY